MTTTQKNYNLTKIEELAQGDPYFVSAIVGQFKQEVPQDLERLNQMIEVGNRALVHEIVNKIKPTLELFSLESYKNALHIEAWSVSEGTMDISAHFNELSADVNLAIHQLNQDM